MRHALAYVLGFGLVFTVLGLTATFALGPLVDYLPVFREIGGVLLVLLGLNLAGVLRIPAMERTIRPFEAGAAGSLATSTGTIALSAPGSGGRAGTSLAERLGGRIVGTRGGWVASLGLGAIFAVGWTPCIGPILGSILGIAASSSQKAEGAILLIAYTAGLGLPFLALAAVYDRAPAILRPLLRHGRLVSIIGGVLVIAIGIAMFFDWLALLPQFVPFNSAI
jgi:cytochrome c-type biogenesis protein